MAKLPRDGDSDGFIFDGTKREMPAPTKLVEVAEKAARAVDDVDAGGERLDPLSITRSGNPVRWKEGGWQPGTPTRWVKGDVSKRTIDARIRAVRALMEDELPQLKGEKFAIDTWLDYDEFHADHPYGDGDVAPVAGWRPKLGEHGTLFVSPEVTRGLSYNGPEAVRDWRIIMHELVHAASPQTGSNSGPEPVMEEGMAEILSTDIAARRLDLAGFASDGRHGRSKWTGMEGLAAGANYKDRVAALIMNAGQRTGWDRDATKAMLRDWWDGGTYSPYFRRIERRDDGLDPDAFAAKRRDEIIARYNDLIARLPEHADEYEADRARELGDVSTLEGDWRWQSNQEWEKGVESARSHGVDVARIPFDYTNEPYWDMSDSREVVAERDTVGASLLYWLLDGSDGRTAETATEVEAPTTEHPTGDRFDSLADAAGAGKVTATDADVQPGMVTVDQDGDPLLHIQAPGDKPDTWVAVDGAGGGRTYRLPGSVDVAAVARSDDPGAALAADAALRGPWRNRRPVSARRRSQAFNLLNEVQAAPMADEPLVAAPDPDVFDGADLKPGDRFDVPIMSAVQADGPWPTRTGDDHTAGLAEGWAKLDPETRDLLDSRDVEQMGARMAPEPRTVLRFDTSRALPGEGGSHTVTGRFAVDGVEDVEDPDGLPYWDGAGFRQSPARVVRAHWVEDVDAPDGRGPVATPPGWTRQGPPVLDDWTTREPVGGWASEADRIRAAQTWPTGSQAVTFTLGDGDGRVDMVVHEPWQLDQQKLAQLGSTVATLQRSFQPPVPSRMKAPVRPVTVDVTPFPGGEQAAAVTWPDDRRMVYDWSALKPGSRADVMEPPWTVRNATRVDDVDYIATHEWGHLVDPEGKWSTKASLRKPVSGYARSAMDSYRARGVKRRRILGAENWAEMFADWAINPETADPESQEVVGQAGFPVPVPPIADLPPGGGLPGEADGGLPGGAGAVVAAVAAGPSWPGDIVVDRFDGRPVDERLVADAYLILGLTPPSANMPASTDDEGADSGRRTDRPAGPNPARRGQDDQAVEGHDRRGDRRPVEGAVQPDEGEAPARRAGVTIAGEEPTGAMVALVPARPQALAVDGGEELGALHLTLKFLGDAADWPADQRAVVERTVADWAAQTPRFTGTVGGAGRLGTDGAMVWHLDVPGLARSREALSAWIDDRTDADTSDRWDGFTPHVTFAYDDVDLPDLPDGDVPFFDAVVCWGPDRTVVPLSGTLGRSAAVLARDGDGDGFIYDGTKREMLAPTRMLDIDIDMELEADAIGERRNAPIGRVQPVTRGSDVAPKPAVDADFGAMRDDAPATKSGKKAARPGGKALIAATLGDRIGAKNGTVAGVRHIETAEEAVRQFVGNLEVVYQAAKKRKGFIAGARQWYDRAHDRAVALADKLDMHPDGGAAVLAALSPNMDWNYNLAQADALAEFWSTDPVVDDEVRKLAKRLVSDLRFKDYKHRLPGDPMKPESKWITLVDVPEGTRLRSGITDPQTRAIYARVWATLHTEGGAFSPELRVDSNGQMVPTGAVPRTRWQSADNIAKALAIMDDPSRANVDRRLGDGLKVRSFYNNIAYPDNNMWPGGDVTVDTHAASTLFGAPYGNQAEPFATIVGKSTVEDGEYIKVAMVEAFRRFTAKHADDFDTPREAQSALWEIWRSAAYSNAGNNEALKQGLRDAWAAVDEPGISDAVRRRRRRKARQLMGEWLSRPLPWIDYDPTKVDADGNPVSPVEEVPDAPTV